MKKYTYSIMCALLFGGIFAYYIFSSKNYSEGILLSEASKVTVVQLGVFSSEENANNHANNFISSIVLKEDNSYKVFGYIGVSEYLIDLVKNYYANENISYFIKDIYINGSLYNELIEYEKLLEQSNNLEVIFKTNQKILNEYIIKE